MVIIYPTKWYESLEDSSRVNRAAPSESHATAARRACMLFVPFRNLETLTNWGELVNKRHGWGFFAEEHHEGGQAIRYRWALTLQLRMINNPELFPEYIRRRVLDGGRNHQEVEQAVPENSDDEWDSTPEITRRSEQEWQMAGRVMGNQMPGQPREFFGTRDIDILHDWNSDLQELQLPIDPENFVETQKQLVAGVESELEQQIVHPHMLNEGQRSVYNFVLSQLDGVLTGSRESLDSVIVMGRGGVGKSFLIRALEYGIWQQMITKFRQDDYPTVRTAVKLAAFTGKAAYQVGGVTIHSLLGIGPKSGDSDSRPAPLKPDQLRRLQQQLKNTRYLFFDEMSMIGLRMLHTIDTRLRQIFPDQADRMFGGLTVILFGDFGQLPPVLDKPLYAHPNQNWQPHITDASRMYREGFHRVFELTEQMRQRGQAVEDIRFQEVLLNLREGQVTIDDWQFLQRRVLSRLPLNESVAFDDAIVLYPINKEVDERNISMLERLGKPVAAIEANYHGVDAGVGANVDSDHCNNLEHVVYLSVNSRVSTSHCNSDLRLC